MRLNFSVLGKRQRKSGRSLDTFPAGPAGELQSLYAPGHFPGLCRASPFPFRYAISITYPREWSLAAADGARHRGFGFVTFKESKGVEAELHWLHMLHVVSGIEQLSYERAFPCRTLSMF